LALDVSGEISSANEDDEIDEDELTVHDVAAEDVQAALDEAEAMMEGAEIEEA
jgi:hypothetical protein